MAAGGENDEAASFEIVGGGEFMPELIGDIRLCSLRDPFRCSGVPKATPLVNEKRHTLAVSKVFLIETRISNRSSLTIQHSPSASSIGEPKNEQ